MYMAAASVTSRPVKPGVGLVRRYRRQSTTNSEEASEAMQMKGFSRSILGQLCRRPPVGFFICSTPPPAVSRRAAPFITASSALQSPLSRFDFGSWSMLFRS